MLKKLCFLPLFFACKFQSYAQFSGPPSAMGSDAMHIDSAAFVDWAKYCSLQRGWKNIQQKDLGFVNYGTEWDAVGNGQNTGVVSLGDSGIAILTFERGIMDLPGHDFAIFENGFDDAYLELAFVEVSSDGVNYFRFPSTSLTPTLTQVGPFDLWADPTKLHNLAGKYRSKFGTPFDLADLPDDPLLHKNNITFVKIIDVIGAISGPFSTYDSQGNVINDPFPSPFESGGFDLDALGIIHQVPLGIEEDLPLSIAVFPNPVHDKLQVSGISVHSFAIYDTFGKLILHQEQVMDEKGIPFSELSAGNYLLFINAQYHLRILKN